MRIQTRRIDGYIVRIIYDDHRNMYIGKFDGTDIPNVYGDTENEIYEQIHEAISKRKGEIK